MSMAFTTVKQNKNFTLKTKQKTHNNLKKRGVVCCVILFVTLKIK